MHTLSEIASELPRMYDEAKKMDRPKTFDQIIRELFDGYGSKFGYENFEIFKRVILKIYNNNKKKPVQTEVFVQKIVSNEEPDTEKVDLFLLERRGEITAYQLEVYKLKKDSY